MLRLLAATTLTLLAMLLLQGEATEPVIGGSAVGVVILLIVIGMVWRVLHIKSERLKKLKEGLITYHGGRLVVDS
jgi:hypothetical protein